jgi:chitosanase
MMVAAGALAASRNQREVSPGTGRPLDIIKREFNNQEFISSVKQKAGNMTFTIRELLKTLIIISIFETSKALADFSTVAVLNDGAGISYGITQFTHRSGSLAEVLVEYIKNGGAIGREIIETRLPIARRKAAKAIATLAEDETFKKALIAAGISREMKASQFAVAFRRYLEPAVRECARLNFTTPLALAVVADSLVHGSWEKIRDRVSISPTSEKAWITEYVRTRDAWLASVPRLAATRYRTRFFLNQIAISNWELRPPLTVHGVKLTEDTLTKCSSVCSAATSGLEREAPNLQTAPAAETARLINNEGTKSSSQSSTGDSPEAVVPPHGPHTPVQPPEPLENVTIGTETRGMNVSAVLDQIEQHVDQAAATYDQTERIATTVSTRTDRAKSLWTTIAGTIGQAIWGLIGVIAGLPREVWLVVAVIAGLMLLTYLYRQITLGKIREGQQ